MKNVYRATRPAWAAGRLEDVVTTVASVVVALYAGFGEKATKRMLGSAAGWVADFWPFVDLVVVTLGCLLLVRLYKKLRVGRYPCTFLYCFKMPQESNLRGRSKVAGYLQIAPDMASGELRAKGASFFWRNEEIDVRSRVGFTSTQIYSTAEEGETTCHIRFNINKADLEKRLYKHGHLQFRLVNHNGHNSERKERDVYAGYLRSMRELQEVQDVEVKSKGYAEWWSKGELEEGDLQNILRNEADALFFRLDRMLRTTPFPSLWQNKDSMPANKVNSWGHSIPTPQAVLLDDTLSPHVENFLKAVLALYGLDNTEVESFVNLARQSAKVNEETQSGFEAALRSALAGETVDANEDRALTNRAEVICREIAPYLEGDSLLDVGCGNGRVANLLKNRFSRILLTDVVKYVPEAYGLPFEPYVEGSALPGEDTFDTVVLLTVLHHSSDPRELLKLAWRKTRKKLIIIESVVGVHDAKPGVKYDLLQLSDEIQIGFAAFVDWFYNRVLHNVPVPYNFTTPEQWQSVFLQFEMPLKETIYLGQDIEVGPEYHILFVLEKPEA